MTIHNCDLSLCMFMYKIAYGWVREEPEGSEMYIRQETITAEEGETVPLTIYFTKNANLFADAFFFYIGTAGTATRM